MSKSSDRADARRESVKEKEQAAKAAGQPIVAYTVGGGNSPAAGAEAHIPLDPARTSALSRAVQQIEKQFGKGAVMRLNGEARSAVEGIPTGSLGLDIALGGVGVPRGRVLEIFGPESSGKTTLALHIVANAQKLGGVAAFVDAEHALDPAWAKRLGVRLDDLLVSQPDTGEQGLEICELLVRSNAVDVIVIDSVAALVPKAELEGEMGDSHVGLQARLMGQALRKLTGAISRSKSTVIFINQIREKIGVMFGNPETTPGGRALKFYASVRIDVRRTGTIKEGEVSVGSRTRARVVKNKIAPPFRDAEFDIMYDRGISYEGDLLDLAVLGNIVEKSGAWFNYKAIRLGQGRENSKQFLIDNKDVGEEIRQAILASKGMIANTMGQKAAAAGEAVEAE
jgi:recombination protein RecA